jgi:2-polyprenyl-6-methoxyphenol hydroxylase-like FAD-dependent oxidoreductase
MPRTALIVGAGIGGLAAALALKRAGWRVRVFERSDSPRELGFALLLAPNALAALRELGIADTVIANGASPANGELRRIDGRVFRRFALPAGEATPGPRAIVTLRPALHGALVDAVGLDHIELAGAVTGFTIGAGGPALTIAGGRRVGGDVVIGADGVGSVIRQALHPDEGPPRASGYVGIRGVAADAVRHLAPLDGAHFVGNGIEAGVARAGARAVYWFLSLLSRDIGSERDPHTLIARLSGGLDPQLRAIIAATAPGDMRFDELFDRRPLDVWGAGPVTLLGDAAHPMLPHAGQGAAQALEDAVGLGLALSAGGPIAPALRRYEAVRARRTRRIVTLARRIARVTTTHSVAIGMLREAAIRLVPNRLLVNSLAQAEQADPNAALRISSA